MIKLLVSASAARDRVGENGSKLENVRLTFFKFLHALLFPECIVKNRSQVVPFKN